MRYHQKAILFGIAKSNKAGVRFFNPPRQPVEMYYD